MKKHLAAGEREPGAFKEPAEARSYFSYLPSRRQIGNSSSVAG